MTRSGEIYLSTPNYVVCLTKSSKAQDEEEDTSLCDCDCSKDVWKLESASWAGAG